MTEPRKALTNCTSWSDLFPSWQVQVVKPGVVDESTPLWPNDLEHESHHIVGWCHVDKGHGFSIVRDPPYISLTVTPSEVALEAIRRSVIFIENERSHFNAIMFDDEVHVYFQYSCIIGNRLLARIPMANFPLKSILDNSWRIAEAEEKAEEPKIKSCGRTVPSEVLDLLKECQVQSDRVILPDRTLPRDLYDAFNKVMADFGGKWNRSAKAHLFERDAMAHIEQVLSTGKSTNVQQSLQAFFTPAEVCKKMVEMAQIGHCLSVLEPSAGDGAICEAIWEADPEQVMLTAVELDPLHFSKLQERMGHSARMYNADFLKWKDPKDTLGYDRVVMNPPFNRGQDVKHILHALSMLKQNGILVAIVPPTFLEKTTGLYKTLWSKVIVIDKVDLPAGTFKDTQVLTCIIKLRKA